MKVVRRADPVAATGGQNRLWSPLMVFGVIAAILLACGVGAFLLAPATPGFEPGAAPAPVQSAASTPTATLAPAAAQAAVSAPSVPSVPSAPAPHPDLGRDLASYVKPGETPTMTEVIERLHKAGIYTGLGAFSPPGTSPPLIGLAVPEDFELPPGYVRHHQATDDGQRIEAILMFAPDRQFYDANGNPIPVPANRVVPPEHAPPGLPLRQIVVPKAVGADSR